VHGQNLIGSPLIGSVMEEFNYRVYERGRKNCYGSFIFAPKDKHCHPDSNTITVGNAYIAICTL
jgi:hypothetical protein